MCVRVCLNMRERESCFVTIKLLVIIISVACHYDVCSCELIFVCLFVVNVVSVYVYVCV